MVPDKGDDAESMTDEDIAAALDHWADEIIGKEMEILTTGQQAKELFLLSRDIPQESDFSGKKTNRSRSDAYRKLYHTRSKISMCLFSDYLEDKAAREEAIYSASPEELAEASAYVDGFYGLLSDSDRSIVELLLGGKTQSEIAAELGISQSKVSKRRKHLQEILLEYDPDIQKILYLFKNNSQKME
jgi:DNA-binding NarL/FixJ family response regulator